MTRRTYLVLSILALLPLIIIAQTPTPTPTSVPPLELPKSPKMKAAVSETITRGFIVDEKALRKLNEILKRRLSERAVHYAITYTVRFSNGFYYDTSAIETVLSEENVAPRQILSCDIAARV